MRENLRIYCGFRTRIQTLRRFATTTIDIDTERESDKLRRLTDQRSQRRQQEQAWMLVHISDESGKFSDSDTSSTLRTRQRLIALAAKKAYTNAGVRNTETDTTAMRPDRRTTDVTAAERLKRHQEEMQAGLRPINRPREPQSDQVRDRNMNPPGVAPEETDAIAQQTESKDSPNLLEPVPIGTDVTPKLVRPTTDITQAFRGEQDPDEFEDRDTNENSADPHKIAAVVRYTIADPRMVLRMRQHFPRIGNTEHDEGVMEVLENARGFSVANEGKDNLAELRRIQRDFNCFKNKYAQWKGRAKRKPVVYNRPVMFKTGDRVLYTYNNYYSDEGKVEVEHGVPLYTVGLVMSVIPETSRICTRFYGIPKKNGNFLPSLDVDIEFHAALNLTTVPFEEVRGIIQYLEDVNRQFKEPRIPEYIKLLPHSEMTDYHTDTMQEELTQDRAICNDAWRIAMELETETREKIRTNRHDVILSANSKYGEDRRIGKIDDAILVLAKILSIPTQYGPIRRKEREAVIQASIQRYLNGRFSSFESFIYECLHAVDRIQHRPPRKVPVLDRDEDTKLPAIPEQQWLYMLDEHSSDDEDDDKKMPTKSRPGCLILDQMKKPLRIIKYTSPSTECAEAKVHKALTELWQNPMRVPVTEEMGQQFVRLNPISQSKPPNTTQTAATNSKIDETSELSTQQLLDTILDPNGEIPLGVDLPKAPTVIRPPDSYAKLEFELEKSKEREDALRTELRGWKSKQLPLNNKNLERELEESKRHEESLQEKVRTMEEQMKQSTEAIYEAQTRIIELEDLLKEATKTLSGSKNFLTKSYDHVTGLVNAMETVAIQVKLLATDELMQNTITSYTKIRGIPEWINQTIAAYMSDETFHALSKQYQDAIPEINPSTSMAIVNIKMEGATQELVLVTQPINDCLDTVGRYESELEEWNKHARILGSTISKMRQKLDTKTPTKDHEPTKESDEDADMEVDHKNGKTDGAKTDQSAKKESELDIVQVAKVHAGKSPRKRAEVETEDEEENEEDESDEDDEDDEDDDMEDAPDEPEEDSGKPKAIPKFPWATNDQKKETTTEVIKKVFTHFGLGPSMITGNKDHDALTVIFHLIVGISKDKFTPKTKTDHYRVINAEYAAILHDWVQEWKKYQKEHAKIAFGDDYLRLQVMLRSMTLMLAGAYDPKILDGCSQEVNLYLRGIRTANHREIGGEIPGVPKNLEKLTARWAKAGPKELVPTPPTLRDRLPSGFYIGFKKNAVVSIEQYAEAQKILEEMKESSKNFQLDQAKKRAAEAEAKASPKKQTKKSKKDKPGKPAK